MNGIGYIYKITNIVDGKIYIGKSKYTVHSRWMGHLRCSKKYIEANKNSSKLYNAMKKYSVDKFTIEEIDSCPYDQLDDRERYWIQKLDSRNPKIGYNICRGGECGPGGPRFAGHQHSEETKQQMSLSRRGENNPNYGNHRVMPEEEKPKHACPGESNGMFGKRHSEETKQKDREKHLGKIWMTDGKKDVHIQPEGEQAYRLAGYRRGRTFAKGKHKS